MNFKFGIILFLTAAFLFGCFQTHKLSGFGQCAAAGNPVMESYPRQCMMNETTYVEEICAGLSLDDALQIAAASECGDRAILDCSCPDGYVKEGDACNPACYYSTPRCLSPSIQCHKKYSCNDYGNFSSTWWISINLEKPGCMPACVVHVEDKSAEINWRCTGFIE